MSNHSSLAKAKPNKAFLILLLVIFIGMAVVLLPNLNEGLAHEMTALETHQVDMTQADDEFHTIYETLKYNRSIHILAMLLAGFGFLMVTVRKHGFTSVTATFLMVSLAIPLYMLIKTFIGEEFNILSVDALLFAEFAAASLLIAIGAPLGRLKMDQYLLMGILFLPIYVFNEWLLLESGYFHGFLDTGGSIAIHAFGAYFGLGVVANTLSKFQNDPTCESDDTSSRFSLLGSMILWLFWPSFTSAIVAPDRVMLTAMNTIFALCGATLATYVFSKLIRGKIDVEDIANAALAGGVAIGSTCDVTTPGYALLIGLAAGALSVIGYAIIAPKLQKLIKGTDTCGIHNLHGMPGLLGGLVAIFITGNTAIQLGAIVTTIVVAFVGGKITGSIISVMGKKLVPYSDEDEFLMGH